MMMMVISLLAIRGALAGSHPCDQIYIMKKDGSDMRLSTLLSLLFSHSLSLLIYER